MKQPNQILHIINRDSSSLPLREDKIIKEGSQFRIYSKLPDDLDFKKLSSYNLLSEALNDPNINFKRTNIVIETPLKLRNIKHLILNQWVDWEKDDSQLALINQKTYHLLLNPLNFPQKNFVGTKPDDNLKDPVCKLLKTIFVSEKNSREYTESKKELKKILDSKGYKSYTGDSRDLGGLNCTGMSVIYKVPYNKRGNLSIYAGKTVRVCCLGSKDRALRECMAGPIEELDLLNSNQQEFIGFLNEINLYADIPTKLQVHIVNRNHAKVTDYLKSNPLSPQAISSLEGSDIIAQLAREGNIEMLASLKKTGVSLGCPIANVEESKKTPTCKYWHSLLWDIQENHPHKVKGFITLYNAKEFKDLVNSGKTYPLLQLIEDIVLTERHRRLKKNLEQFSKSTLEI